MPFIEKVATITARGRTTVPKAVRQALGADYGGKIVWRVDEHGVGPRRAENEEDPTLAAFLGFLTEDIRRHPERIGPISPEFAARLEALTQGIEIDPEAAIEGETTIQRLAGATPKA